MGAAPKRCYALQTRLVIRKDVRLILSLDSTSSSFVGIVENVTTETKDSVHVEVHLSNGVELGPTTPIDLVPGTRKASSSPQPDNPSIGGKRTRNLVKVDTKESMSMKMSMVKNRNMENINTGHYE